MRSKSDGMDPESAFASILGDEVGRSFWRKGVEPHFRAVASAYKTDFEYDIALIDLEESVVLTPGDSGARLQLEASAYRRLDTVIKYTLHADDPPSAYSVGCAFSPTHLPEWFSQHDFLLRELVNVSELLELDVAALAGEPAAARDFADALFHVAVTMEGDALLPTDGILVDEKGILRSYALTTRQREAIREGAAISVESQTFQPVGQTFFPANITTPTLRARLDFHYDRASIRDVHVEPFFSSRKPYMRGLVSQRRDRRHINVEPPGDDWVFIGDGCVFMWANEAIAPRDA